MSGPMPTNWPACAAELVTAHPDSLVARVVEAVSANV